MPMHNGAFLGLSLMSRLPSVAPSLAYALVSSIDNRMQADSKVAPYLRGPMRCYNREVRALFLNLNIEWYFSWRRVISTAVGL